MKLLDDAILLCDKLIEDAEFSERNLVDHKKHAREMGITLREYNRRAKRLSETGVGGNVIGYTRSDGREARVNTSTREYILFVGNEVVTYYILRGGQVKRIVEGEKL